MAKINHIYMVLFSVRRQYHEIARADVGVEDIAIAQNASDAYSLIDGVGPSLAWCMVDHFRQGETRQVLDHDAVDLYVFKQMCRNRNIR